MINVFVSSTVRDLDAYREETCRYIKALQLEPITMDHWPASTRPPVSEIEDRLKASQLLVGIVAWCRGSALPNDPKTSFVQHEFQFAHDNKLPRLVFLADEES